MLFSESSLARFTLDIIASPIYTRHFFFSCAFFCLWFFIYFRRSLLFYYSFNLSYSAPHLGN